MKRLDNKIAIITGGARGMGAATVRLFVAEGAKVIIADLLDVDGEALAAELGDAARFVHHDVTDESSWQAVLAAAGEWGPVDVLVNNAGITRDNLAMRMKDEEWEAVIDTNLKAVFRMSRLVMRGMMKARYGRIVSITSVVGSAGNPGQANYAAAKLGIVGLSRSIALDMARYNVTSNAIAPFAWSRLIGTIPTTTEAERIRVERMKRMTPAKVAPLVAALSSDRAQHVSGQVFAVRSDEVFLFNQSRPVRGLGRSDGWTAESILEHALPAFGTALTPLERSADVFCWDPY